MLQGAAYFWHTLGSLMPNEYSLNATPCPIIVAEDFHPFMTTMNLSSDGYFQWHKAQNISKN